jgi:hypothetical protein
MGLVLLPLSIVLAAVGILVVPPAGEALSLPSIVAAVLLGSAGLAFVLGISLPLARAISAWRYDPNSEDEDIRRALGKACACSEIDYDSGKAIPPA